MNASGYEPGQWPMIDYRLPEKDETFIDPDHAGKTQPKIIQKNSDNPVFILFAIRDKKLAFPISKINQIPSL